MKKTALILLTCAGVLFINSESVAQSTDKEKKIKMDQTTNNLTELQLAVEGMHCQAGCANGIDNMLKEQKGVVSSETLFDTSSSVIRYDNKLISEKDIIALIQERGFKAERKAEPKK